MHNKGDWNPFEMPVRIHILKIYQIPIGRNVQQKQKVNKFTLQFTVSFLFDSPWDQIYQKCPKVSRRLFLRLFLVERVRSRLVGQIRRTPKFAKLWIWERCHEGIKNDPQKSGIMQYWIFASGPPHASTKLSPTFAVLLKNCLISNVRSANALLMSTSADLPRNDRTRTIRPKRVDEWL